METLPTKLLIRLIDILSYPLTFLDYLRKHKTVRSIVILTILVTAIIGHYFGWNGILTALMLVGRLAFVIVFIVIQFVAMFMFLARGSESEHYPGEKGEVTFEKDYYGNVNEIKIIKHWTHLLTADRHKLKEMGAKTISGILMSGPPGVGKTMAARCLATASGAAFFALSASSISAMFIGIPQLKIKRLVSKARSAAKQYIASIIFFDELDALGASRGMVEDGSHRSAVDWYRALTPIDRLRVNLDVHPMVMGAGMGGGGLGALSTLLTEMDGVQKLPRRDEIQNSIRKWLGLPEIYQGVVLFMGATNRPAVLDPALVRPGRFDRTIKFSNPDASTRRALFRGYISKIKCDKNIDIETLVDVTAGVSHAFIASALETDSPRLALFDGRGTVTQRDILQAIEERVVGIPNPITDLDPEQKRQIAFHESGHAILAIKLRPEKRIANVSIIRRGSGVLGYVRDVERKETFAMPLSRVSANIMVSLAGHEAVYLEFKEHWTGGSQDFQHVAGYMKFLRDHGEFGAIPINDRNTLMWKRIDEREDQYMQNAIQGTRTVLQENWKAVTALAEALIEKEELLADEIYAIVNRSGYVQ